MQHLLFFVIFGVCGFVIVDASKYRDSPEKGLTCGDTLDKPCCKEPAGEPADAKCFVRCGLTAIDENVLIPLGSVTEGWDNLPPKNPEDARRRAKHNKKHGSHHHHGSNHIHKYSGKHAPRNESTNGTTPITNQVRNNRKNTMTDIEISVDLDLSDPPEDLLEYARTELGENPDTLPKVLQEFKDMIYELGECTPHKMDDKFLMRFLRARSFCLPRAHRLLVNYYKFKENYPEIHENVYPLKLRFIGEDDVMSVMPYRDQNGRRIILYRMGNWSPSKYSVDELFKATLVVLELGILEQRTQILGGVAIFDLSGISLQHAWNVTPSIARKVVDLMVTSFPLKISAIHILYQSWVFDIIYTIFRPLLNDKMRESIFFHGTDMESLHKHISPKCLPLKYGGMQKEYPYTLWLDALSKNEKIIKEMLELGYLIDDEEKGDEEKK